MSLQRGVQLLVRLSLCVGCLTLSGCFTRDQFDQLVEEASTCSAADTCRLAGHPDASTTCTCPVPVRSSEGANIDAAARQVNCGGMAVKCVGWVNPRCEAGRCIADQVGG